MKHWNLTSCRWEHCNCWKDGIFCLIQPGCNLTSPYEKPVWLAKSKRGAILMRGIGRIPMPVKRQRLLRTCKRIKVTVWEHIFVCASLCGWAVLFSLEIFNFLQTNRPLPPPQLSLSSPLLWSNCYLNVSTWLLFWRKKWCIIFITNYCT